MEEKTGNKSGHPEIKKNFSHFLWHARTLWLFTRSDLKTIVVPQSVLASCNALSGSIASKTPGTALLTLTALFGRLPIVLWWIWVNLLVADISNQRLSSSIEEDAQNKPWRPIPSQRLSQDAATRLLGSAVVLALSTSYFLGPQQLLASSLLIVFLWLYNELEGANASFMIRNALNACGYTAFGVGGTAIAVGSAPFSAHGRAWFMMLWAAIFTTIQVQDLADIAGDSVRGRKTMPIAYGDQLTRWSIVVPVLGWSAICPWFWNATPAVSAVTAALGGVFAVQLTGQWGTAADKLSLKMWCGWLTVISLLPLLGTRSS